jgi:hypothetical protein
VVKSLFLVHRSAGKPLFSPHPGGPPPPTSPPVKFTKNRKFEHLLTQPLRYRSQLSENMWVYCNRCKTRCGRAVSVRGCGDTRKNRWFSPCGVIRKARCGLSRRPSGAYRTPGVCWRYSTPTIPPPSSWRLADITPPYTRTPRKAKKQPCGLIRKPSESYPVSVAVHIDPPGGVGCTPHPKLTRIQVGSSRTPTPPYQNPTRTLRKRSKTGLWSH